MPCPASRIVRPFCVSGGIRSDTRPFRVGTGTSPPSPRKEIVGTAESPIGSLPEERSEEVGEPARVAERVLARLARVDVLEPARARGPCAGPSRVLLPLGADRVVALAFLGIAED